MISERDMHEFEATIELDLPGDLIDPDGFDAFVSYAYAGGTELTFIVPE